MDKVEFARVPCQLWLLNDKRGPYLFSMDIAEFARVSCQQLHDIRKAKEFRFAVHSHSRVRQGALPAMT
jgi:hypothetical protein